MLMIAQTATHRFVVVESIRDRVYGRYPTRAGAEYRVKQINTSRQTVRTSRKWDKAAA